MMEEIIKSFETFKSITKHPEVFLKQQNENACKIQKDMLESIYCFNKRTDSNKKSKSLPKLITNGMDDESIWQQLELQNEEHFQSNLKIVSKFLATNSDKFKLNIDDLQDDVEDEEEDEENSEIEENESGEENEEGNEQDDDDDEENEGNDNAQEDDYDEEEEGSEMENDNENAAVSFQRKNMRRSIVDDQFFKLSEMEEFLEDQDRREMRKGSSRNNDEDEGIDYFADDNDDVNLQESLRYNDFFDNEEEGENDDDNEGENDESNEQKPKSSFELKQERLQKKIQRMEDDMLEEKTWQMKGEIKADIRPQNSLLEEILEFDSTTRPAPIITETVSLKLEDIIKQRIKDKAFDDVERKVKPSDVQFEYKKQVVLDQEKSKQSLAQVYEKEYLKEIEKNNPDAADEEEEEPKEHKEIRSELKDLFEKLDMLSNFFYTPKPAQPELKIITNLPTISMEEVAPVSVSDATLLAPEEIKNKTKGANVIGAGERTKTDKNRERRHKKVYQREKFSKQKTGKEAITNKVLKHRNVEKMNNTGESTKSSSAFFSKLQDEISLSKSSKNNNKRKGEKPNHDAKKLKL